MNDGEGFHEGSIDFDPVILPLLGENTDSRGFYIISEWFAIEDGK